MTQLPPSSPDDQPRTAAATAAPVPSTSLGTARMVAYLLVATLGFLVLALVAPWFWQQLQPPAPQSAQTTAQGLPWQIHVHPDGSSTVMGVTLGQDTLAQAVAHWPDEVPQVAVMQAASTTTAPGALSLEVYLESVRAGFVQGKLVLSGAAPEAALQAWSQRSPKRQPQASGTTRTDVSEADKAAALAQGVSGLVFLPAARLDEATVQERFGPPAQRRTGPDGMLYLLYPAQGVVVTVDPGNHQKPVIQYVAPKDFARLSEPFAAH